VLDPHPLIKEVTGLPDDKWGDRVTVVIVAMLGVTPAHWPPRRCLVRERKGAVHAPKTVEFVDAVPLTTCGKYDKKALVASLAAP